MPFYLDSDSKPFCFTFSINTNMMEFIFYICLKILSFMFALHIY